MNSTQRIAVRLLLAHLALTAAFAQGPANVLLVINDNSPVSRNIGEYYARKRGIQSKNICRIKTTMEEDIARSAYDHEISAPIRACLTNGGLIQDVLYIVTTLGVPLRIEGSAGPDGDIAAVDSELTLLYSDMLHLKPHVTKGLLPNPFFGQRDAKFRHPQFPIYLVTRLAAYDFQQVRAMIDKSIEARNRGKFVIDLKLLDSTEGNDWLLNAAIALPKDRVILDQSQTVLYGQQDVIAYASWGSNDPNRKQRMLGFKWLPGAIATEYVSTDARTFQRPPDSWNISDWGSKNLWWAGAPQTLSADFLMEGATGASGHVTEPYLMATPRPDYLLPAYFQGRNLAESYYMAIHYLSWQNIVIGDPLCALAKP